MSATGPTFWFGGTVTDPASLFGQGFLEVQFYPDSIVSNCTPGGGFVVSYAPNTYTVCSPVWSVHATGQKPVFHEPAAFNAMLTTGSSHQPLVMHAGDTIDIHFHVVSQTQGWHIDVRDETTSGSGTIVLNSADGPLLPAFDKQEIGNALGWGSVFDTPNSFVWEIGHTSPFTSPASKFCIPGQPICQSFNSPAWAGTSPIQIKSVTFGDGSHPAGWATVSDTGGKAEVLGNSFVGPTSCATYGGRSAPIPSSRRGRAGSTTASTFPTRSKTSEALTSSPRRNSAVGPLARTAPTATRRFRSSSPDEPRRAGGPSGSSARFPQVLVS